VIKKLIQIFIFLILIFAYPKSSLAQAATCGSYTANLDGEYVNISGSGCDPDGSYLVHLLSGGEVVEASSVFVSGGSFTHSFHLNEDGVYSTRLIFSAELIDDTGPLTYTASGSAGLSCGDPCNANDSNCPSECPSVMGDDGNWSCAGSNDFRVLRPDECTYEGSKGLKTSLGCIPVESSGFIAWLLKIGISIGGGIAFLLMVWGGFIFVTSSGNPEKVKQGQEIIVSALVGLLFIIFSIFILEFIGVDILAIPGLTK
jgi:hypothetical protein